MKGIFVVGLGGTGGLLVPKLAKILQGTKDIELWLMDGDIVDLGNVQRQPYQSFNVNEKKARALSRKITSNYNLAVFDYSDFLVGGEIKVISESENYTDIFILGCVDNHSTRILLEEEHKSINNSVYIDSANGFEDGSIFITHELLYQSFGTVRSDIFTEMKDAKDHPTGTCGVEISKGNTQQFVTNDIMANSIAYVVNEYLANRGWTGVIKINGLERIFIRDES